MNQRDGRPLPTSDWTLETIWIHPLLRAAFLIWVGGVLIEFVHSGRPGFFSPLNWIRHVPPIWQISGSAFLSHCHDAARVLGFLVVSAGVGRAVHRRVLKCDLGVAESIFFSTAIGLGLMGTVMALLAMCRVLDGRVVYGTGLVLAAAAAGLNLDLARGLSSLPGRLLQSIPARGAVPAAALCAAALMQALLLSLAPDVFYDAHVYHLALPSLYKMVGGMFPVPTLVYAGIPMQFEMLYLWGMYFGGRNFPQLLHASTFALAVLGLNALAARAGRPQVGWWAGAVFLTAPFVGDAAHRAGVEGGSVLWMLASVYAAAAAVGEERSARGWVLVSGLAAGFAMAAKYTNWPGALLVGGLLLASSRTRREVPYFLWPLAAVALPWVVKNLVHYGNPIFPFLDDYFSPEAAFPVQWRALAADAKARDWVVVAGSWTESLRLIFHPWFLTMEGDTDHDAVGPAFLILAPLLAGLRYAHPPGRLVVWAAVGLWLCWWPLSALPRFFMPGLCLLSFLVAESAAAVPPGPRRACLALLALIGVANLGQSSAFASRLELWPVVLGREPARRNLLRGRETYPAPLAGGFDWVNSNTPQDSIVLVVGDGRTFGLNRRFIPNSMVDRQIFFHLLDGAEGPGALREGLAAFGVTHLVVNMAWLAKLTPPPDSDGRREGVLRDFMVRCTDTLHEERHLPDERWSLVYRLLEECSGSAGNGGVLPVWFARQVRR